MKLSFSLLLYPMVSIATLWLAFLWLWSRRHHTRRVGLTAKLLTGIATSLLLFIPFGDVPLWNRIFSYFPNPSVPTLAIIGAGLWAQLFGTALFKRSDWDAIWIFGVIVGGALYLHPIFFGALDLYFWGWDRVVSAWTVGLVAVALLTGGVRLGVLLLGALVAYGCTALESSNCWNYVMDPVYWLISTGVLGARGVATALRRLDWLPGRGSHDRATNEV